MTDQSKILVTGASGFVGSALICRLRAEAGYLPVAASRASIADAGEVEQRRHDLENPSVLPSLDDIGVVVHTAARVHVMRESATDSLAEFRRVNVAGTVDLARAAALAGVKRFIFISSIKVNGEQTADGCRFGALDVPAPQDPYAISKYEAEVKLREIEAQTGMSVVIIRPPLVYGPGVGANFKSMMRVLLKGWPLPLGAINNRRSLVGIANLVDLIIATLQHPAAAGRTFLVSDGVDLSTTQLLRSLAAALAVPARLLPVPRPVLERAAGLLGKGAIAQRLCGSLVVDITDTCNALNWTPPVSQNAGLKATADDYLAHEHP
jgi:nucleoside-diphosphate-sugar epimerase